MTGAPGLRTAVGLRTVVGAMTPFFQPGFLFRVPTARGDVYMRVDRREWRKKSRSVVEVDAGKFLALWRNAPGSIHRDVSFGSPVSWVRNSKFDHAHRGFSRGLGSPVPLADIGCAMRSEHTPIIEKCFLFFQKTVGYASHVSPYVSFTDGITRTIWLMSHGATYFPVECPTEEAGLLQDAAGLQGGMPVTVEALTCSPPPGSCCLPHSLEVAPSA